MVSKFRQWDYIAELDLTGGTVYVSKHGEVTWNGHTYEPRIQKVEGLSGIFIDRRNDTFPELTLTLDNIASNWSGTFPFHSKDAVASFEDRAVRVYRYDRTSGEAVLRWHGLLKRPEFDPKEISVTLSATNYLDSIETDIPIITLSPRCPYAFGGSSVETAGGTVPSVGCPYATYGIPGFTTCAKTLEDCTERGMERFFGGLTHIAPTLDGEDNNFVDRGKVRESRAPIVIGDGPLKIRPIIYRAVVSGNELIVNGIISTCHVGLPFDEDQFPPERFKLWGEVRASAVEIKLGTQPQEVPGNRHLFPEKAGHSLWCYFAARFPLTPEQKDRAAQAKLIRDVAVRIDGGRRILRGGVRTENPVYALEDILRDPLNGLGLPEAVIDGDAVESAASYVGTRFRGRFEISKPQPLLDFVMNFVGSFHGYVTFNDGLMQIGAKRHNETPVAVFGTGGYPFVTEPRWSERDSSEIVNEGLFKYHNKVRKATKFVLYDKGLQIAAANHGPRNKAVTEEWYLQGIYDSNEAAIAAAIWMREEINLNAFITCTVELADYEESGVKVGDIIRVNSPHLVDPATNYLWRVIEDPEDTDQFTVTLTCQIYDGIVYSYSADPIGDIIRDGQEPSTGGRPPDMEDCEAEVVQIFTNENDPDDADDDSKDVRVRVRGTYPDLTAEMEEDHEEGYAAEYPIIGYQIFWRFTDETALHYNRGVFVKYPETEGFQTLPYHRKKDVEFLFASVARNNATGEIGYVLDPTKTTFLDEDVDDTEPAIDVDDASVFAGAVYARCEGEIMKVAAVAGDTVTMVASGGNREPQFGTDALEHPEGTEIGVAKLSHPSVIVDMAVRKYKMKKVANVVARQRPKGVRVKWKNLARYDNEHYRVYWTFTDLLGDDADYVTDWITEDPENPPDGVQVVPAGRQAHVLIPQEEIDAVYGSDASGVELKIRVAAYIKQNNSEALSDLANASHGNAPNGPPSTPKPGMWRFERVPGSERVKVFLKIGAKEEAEPYTTTFEAQNMALVGALVEKWIKASSSWEGVLRKFGNSPHEVEDDTLASVEIMDTLHLGSKWRVRKTFGKNRGTKRKVSPDVTTAIFVVGDEQDDVDVITDLAIAAFGTDEDTDSIKLDSNDSQLLTSFTQPSTAVALRRMRVRKRQLGATHWRKSPSFSLTDQLDDNGNSFNTPGAKEFRIDVHHPKNVEMEFGILLEAADGSESDWFDITTTTPAGGGGIEDTVKPGAPTTPVATWRHGHLRLRTTRPTTGNNTIVDYEWQVCAGSGFGTHAPMILDNGAVGIGGVSATVIHSGASPKVSIAVTRREIEADFGATTFYARVRAVNLYTADPVGDWSTTLTYDFSNDEDLSDIQVPSAPATPTARAKHGHLRLKSTDGADGFNSVWRWEWQVCSDNTFTGNGARWFLQDNDTTPLVQPTVGNEPKLISSEPKLSIPVTKAELAAGFSTLNIRVRAYNRFGAMVGAWSSTGTFALSGAEDVPLADTAAPSAPGTPTGRFRKGNLRLKTTKPTSQDASIYQYEWQVASANTFPDNIPDGEAWYVTDNDAAPLDNTTESFLLSSGVHKIIPIKKAEITALTGPTVSTLFFRVRAYNRFGGSAVGAWSSVGSLTVSTLDDDASPPTNPGTAPAAPTFVRGTIGTNGTHVRYSKPADARPYLQRMEIQLVDNTSATLSTARDWLDPDDGTIAVAATAPNTDPNATGVLAAATFPGTTEGKFHAADLQYRDLATTFTNNATNGTLTLGCRARYVDLDDTGAERLGAWSAFSAITRKSQVDRDTDVPTRTHAAGTGNQGEGWGCGTDAASYPAAAGNHGNSNTMGLMFYVQPKNSQEELALTTFAAAKKWNGSAWVAETGNPWDSGNRGTYWDKTVPCVVIYGQSGSGGYATQADGNIFPAICSRIPANVRQGEVWWFTFAIAPWNVTSLPSIANLLVQIWDRGSNLSRAAMNFTLIDFGGSNNFKLMTCRLVLTSTFTGNAWLRISTPNFTQSTNHRLLLSQGIFRRGPTPPRVWIPGRYESNVDVSAGVNLAPFRNLQTLDMSGGLGSDNITTFGELIA